MARTRWIAALCALAALGAGAAARGQGNEPREGRDYGLVVPAWARPAGDRVVVTEFFSYACPHCFAFAPALGAWEAQLPADVALERVAVALGREVWTLPAQLFYGLRALGKDKELDAAVFAAIHVEHVGFGSLRETADWVARRGVDRAAFEAAVGSFSVKSFLARGEQLARSAQVRGVPTLVIDGRYRVEVDTNGDLAGQLRVVDALVARARAERAGAPAR